MNQSEERLSSALRELAASSRQGASPELGMTLKDAFRHHHGQRRRALRVRVTLLCACVAVLAASFLFRKPVVKTASQETAAVHTIPAQEVTYPTESSSANRTRPTVRKDSARLNGSRASDAFVALPSFDVVPASDELRIVRLEMPGEDLRLVGAPVVEGIAGRRVTADFVVGHDGTPYAVRLVRTSF